MEEAGRDHPMEVSVLVCKILIFVGVNNVSLLAALKSSFHLLHCRIFQNDINVVLVG